MLKLYDFISLSGIEKIAENIKNKKDFNYEQEIQGHKLTMNSSRAVGNWENGTKDGDYFIGINWSTSTKGSGGPCSGSELKELADKDKLKEKIDDFLGSKEIDGYQKLDEGQIDLFSL